MSEDSEHWALQVEAVELWGQGKLAEAREKYEAAIALCPADHHLLWSYRGGYAGVLTALNLLDDACVQRELVLEGALAEGEGDGSTKVALARYFLGLNCVQLQAFQRALDVIAPSLRVASKSESLLQSVRAQALAGLGRHEEAFVAATAAITTARSEKQRHNLEVELAAFLKPLG
jgi:tetratricopeptide (TPR) repeat protein